MVTVVEMRKISKNKALQFLKEQGLTASQQLCAQLSQFNGWTLAANLRLLKELELVEFVENRGGFYRLPPI